MTFKTYTNIYLCEKQKLFRKIESDNLDHVELTMKLSKQHIENLSIITNNSMATFDHNISSFNFSNVKINVLLQSVASTECNQTKAVNEKHPVTQYRKQRIR